MNPQFSIITPVYNPPLEAFERCIESVFSQTYSDWEWCLVDDASTDLSVRNRLLELQKTDPRIKVYLRSENGGIVACSNDAISTAQGIYLVLLDNDDELDISALDEVAKVIQANPQVDYIYSDEDKLTVDGERYEEFKKPRWSPERLLAQNYCSHLSVIRKELADRVGRFKEGFDGSQDYDLVLRIAENTDKILHIPKVLYHWRAIPGSAAVAQSEKPYAFIAAKKAVSDHLARRGIAAEVSDVFPYSLIQVRRHVLLQPKISIIIPTCGTVKPVFGVETCLVANAVRSIEEKTSYKNYEIIVIADDKTPAEVVPQLLSICPNRLRVLDYHRPFNFSEKCNIGVVNSDAPYFLFLNDDTEIITPDWLQVLVGYMQDKDVAMVGPMLLFEDGRIQSAGHSNNPRPHNFFNGRSSTEIGEFGMLRIARECSGVTGACALIKREAYFAVGGLSNTFPLAFNDIDLAYKLMEHNYRIIWTPMAKLFHFETASRPDEVDDKEIELITNRWGRLFDNDEFCRIE